MSQQVYQAPTPCADSHATILDRSSHDWGTYTELQITFYEVVQDA